MENYGEKNLFEKLRQNQYILLSYFIMQFFIHKRKFENFFITTKI